MGLFLLYIIPMIKQCTICRTEFKDTTSNLNKIYCNYKCKLVRNNKAKRTLPDSITKSCAICNVDFVDTTSRKHQKYCSSKCRNKFKMNNKSRKLFMKKYIASGRRKEVRIKYDKSDKGRKCSNHHVALRHARKLRAIPKWVCKKELEEIKFIYKNRKKGYHVDHIIPLQGINVCGLHTKNNLRIVKAKYNLSKGNKLIESLL